MLKAIIIDDEAPARDLIRYYLKKFPDINIIAECSNGFEGLREIQARQPDIIFLDVKMPKISGFELLELIENPPVTIFSTAFDEFAVKAFESNAVDYLLKPYSEERFGQAIEKALERANNGTGIKNIQNAVQSFQLRESVSRIVVKNGSHIEIIPLSEIFYLEAQDDYVAIYSRKGRFLKQTTMKKMELILPSTVFPRVHRSYIVRVDQISKIEAYSKDSYQAILAGINNSKQGQTTIPVSRTGYQVLRKLLDI